jgi:hypothetical protein
LMGLDWFPSIVAWKLCKLLHQPSMLLPLLVKFLEVLFSSSVNVFDLFAKFYFMFWQSTKSCICSSLFSFRLHFVSIFASNFAHSYLCSFFYDAKVSNPNLFDGFLLVCA